ncbi:sigma-70 family RNA polymerase sigma factor [Nitratireductor aquibiodomus]|uniref:sigma-70 family RNA polymerase sigma factor n=1 Tax=Nitratireductor aquibiodomus TaxID=204799 RepID=UPI000469B27D|nr:sigma-70 family RNA polymerase sigma factor [Nitratireductor aquibiodomus]
MSGNFHNWLADLFKSQHQELVRFAARLVGGRDGGEEVIQNTYLRLVRRSKQGDVIDYPRAYAYSVARRAAFDFTAERNREWLQRVDFEDTAVDGASTDPTPLLDRRQRVLKLSVVLNELPEACQRAFILNKIEGHTHREIASRLGISISMVEKHIIRAMIHCRDTLRDDEAL